MSFDLRIRDGDLKLGRNGDLDIVQDTEKLVQDIVKIVSTQIGANPFFPWYGSPITKSLLGRSFDRRFVSSVATQQLRTTLERLQTLQQDQMRRNQIVTPQEQIAAIQKVYVDRNIVDPRFYTIVLTVLTKAFSKVEIPLSIRL
jgi:phage baseplate assembly protein W